MNRDGFKRITRIRLTETRILLRTKHYDGAYYLCGYAVECALKACIAKQTKRYEFPDKDKVRDSYTHKLSQLVKLAGLQTALELESASNPGFGVNWATVKDWSEESRYAEHSEQTARDLYAAVTSRKNGVLTWIKQYW